MSNRDFEEWFMKEIADDEGDYNKPVYEAAKWAWQARVPEGYVVVPVDPNEDMIMAGCMEHGGYDVIDSKSIYKAMLEAVEK